jgi:uncharacterized protein (TIGR02284 family)
MRFPRFVPVLASALLFVACGDKDKNPPGGSQEGGKPRYDQPNDRAEDLNKLVRGELSAVDSYDTAIKRYGSETGGDELRRIREDHVQSVGALKGMVTRAGGTPATSAGLWGDIAKAVEGTAKLIENDAAFKVLKEGEEHGIREYESALNDKDVSEDDKKVIRDTLLPKLREHVSALDALRKRT